MPGSADRPDADRTRAREAAPAPGDPRALVTGASSGIGAAFARELRARGERLVIAARRADRLEALAAELGGEAVVTALPVDLAEPGAPERLLGEIEARGLHVDLLVNNAGLGHRGHLQEAPLERLREIVDVNVRAAVALTRLVLPGMLARGRGRIVNVVSMAAFQPVPFLGVYGASKAFLLSFTEALATELAGTPVRVQALCPGNIPTEFQAVAGTEGALYSRLPSRSPEYVVRRSLDALPKRRVRVIPDPGDRLVVALERLLPAALARRVSARLFRPR